MAKQIPLMCGGFALVSEPDYDWLMQWNWSCGSNGYVKRQQRINGRNVCFYMHREIMKCKSHIDHINRRKRDNRRENLRECNQSQNQANREKQKDNKSGYKGVHWHSGAKKWQAQVSVRKLGKKNKFHLGYFLSPAAAGRAYDKKARELFGEFARLNFPE
jgi:hypothetical protein